MDKTQIIVLAVGLGVPLVFAPLVVLGLKHLFALFVAEGAELFANVNLTRSDSRTLGALLAKLNVVVLLLAWLALWTCRCLGQDPLVVTAIGLAGLLLAMIVTMMIVRVNLEVEGRPLLLVGLLTFAGGNLPLILLTAVMTAILSIR